MAAPRDARYGGNLAPCALARARTGQGCKRGAPTPARDRRAALGAARVGTTPLPAQGRVPAEFWGSFNSSSHPPPPGLHHPAAPRMGLHGRIFPRRGAGECAGAPGGGEGRERGVRSGARGWRGARGACASAHVCGAWAHVCARARSWGFPGPPSGGRGAGTEPAWSCLSFKYFFIGFRE